MCGAFGFKHLVCVNVAMWIKKFSNISGTGSIEAMHHCDEKYSQYQKSKKKKKK